MDAYLDIPEVSAIIGLYARSRSNMRIVAEDKKGNEVDTPETKKVLALLAQPNWFQAGKEFQIQTSTMRCIYGNEFIYTDLPFGFKLDKAEQLFTIPPNLVKSRYNSKTPFYKNITGEGVEYSVLDGYDYKAVAPNQIIHLNDNRVAVKSSTDEDLLNGESKLLMQRVVLNNMRKAYESRGVILTRRGADGAWVNKTKDATGTNLPLEVDEKEVIKDIFQTQYGLLDGQSDTIFTDQDLLWVQAGAKDPSKLGLFQEIEEGFYKLLDAFGMPSEMFVRIKGATFANRLQAEKVMYTSTLIPDALEWLGALSKQFFPEQETRLRPDYSHLPCFQEDIKFRADALNVIIQALSKALLDQVITIEEYREELVKYGIKKQNVQ